jgi:hypothetical protein
MTSTIGIRNTYAKGKKNRGRANASMRTTNPETKRRDRCPLSDTG